MVGKPQPKRAKAPAPRIDGPQAAERDWALLFYLVSDAPRSDESAPGTNSVNLDTILTNELRAIGRAAARSPQHVHVALQADLLRNSGTLRWSTVDDRSIVAPEQTSTNPNVLAEFLQWGIEQCPARRYAVVFWGHSAGPSGLFTDELPCFGLGAPRVDTLNLRDLGRALEQGNAHLREHRHLDRFEAVIFKDCFQSLLETCFELGRTSAGEPRADYMIASQGLIPVATRAHDDQRPTLIKHWPFSEIIDALGRGQPSRPALRTVLQHIGAFYSVAEHRSEHIEVPMALLDLGAVMTLAAPLANLRAAMSAVLRDPTHAIRVERAIRVAFRGIVDGDPVLVDLASLCERLAELSIDTKPGLALKASADTVRNEIGNVVLDRTPPGSRFNGLSVYHYPEWAGDRHGSAIGLVDTANYLQLRLNQVTGWGDIALADTPTMAASRRLA